MTRQDILPLFGVQGQASGFHEVLPNQDFSLALVQSHDLDSLGPGVGPVQVVGYPVDGDAIG